MFPEEADKIERYVVRDSPESTMEKTSWLQSQRHEEAIEMATELMDEESQYIASGKLKNKRKLEKPIQKQPETLYLKGLKDKKKQKRSKPTRNREKDKEQRRQKKSAEIAAGSARHRTLPSQTVTNPREQINAITTRSGKTCEGPSTPLVPTTPVVSIPQKEPEQNPETSMDKVQKPSSKSTAQVPPPEEEESIFMEIPKSKAKKTVNIEIQEPNSPRPNSYQPKLPYPERMKVRENDKPSAQHSRFLKMFKQLRLEIGLKDALEMPKVHKMVKHRCMEQREARRMPLQPLMLNVLLSS
ncbi:hypothetical protein Tco_1417793 [Tanacetum coccineum]